MFFFFLLMHFHTPMTRTCVRTPPAHAHTLTLVQWHAQTRTAPEQNSIINGLIARVELLWESEPATLNKIKPLLYIFIIPNRVLNCKCVSETHRCPSLLPLPSSPSPPPRFFFFFSCCLTTANPLLILVPLPHRLHVSMLMHTH